VPDAALARLGRFLLPNTGYFDANTQFTTFLYMTFDELIFLLFLISMALLGISIIAVQIIREKLFARILKTRSFTLDGSWYTETRKTTLKMKYIWGKKSKEMLCHGDLKYFIVGARIASIIWCLSIAGILFAMKWMMG
jgi:hypothetical protein